MCPALWAPVLLQLGSYTPHVATLACRNPPLTPLGLCHPALNHPHTEIASSPRLSRSSPHQASVPPQLPSSFCPGFGTLRQDPPPPVSSFCSFALIPCPGLWLCGNAQALVAPYARLPPTEMLFSPDLALKFHSGPLGPSCAESDPRCALLYLAV